MISSMNNYMQFSSSAQFVIKIKQNHIISSMKNYIQFSSSAQFVIKIQHNHIISSMNKYMQFSSSTQFVSTIQQNHIISSMDIYLYVITQYILANPSAMANPLLQFVHSIYLFVFVKCSGIWSHFISIFMFSQLISVSFIAAQKSQVNFLKVFFFISVLGSKEQEERSYMTHTF